LEVKIKNKLAFSVLGIEGCGDADKSPEWIKPLWDQARNRFEEIRNLVKLDQLRMGESWGLMSATDKYLSGWKDKGKYLAGWEVEPNTQPPKGWTIWNIPEQMFTVIACTMATYGEAYNFIIQQFLPKEGYEQVGAMHEFYPKEFQNIEKDTLYLYIPIIKK
jgi:predicted transcriptional regulator YdeE